MQLIEKNITKKLKDYDEIGEFMKRVFPKEELMPMWLICLVSKMKNYNFKAYYDGEMFVGLLFTINSKDSLFVFYIAVNDEVQSKGYGTKLLAELFRQYPDKPISLFIETMDDTQATNYQQRVKRLTFYKRNGFYHTGIKAGTKTPFIDILSTNENFSVKEAKKLLRMMPMKIFTSELNNQ